MSEDGGGWRGGEWGGDAFGGAGVSQCVCVGGGGG